MTTYQKIFFKFPTTILKFKVTFQDRESIKSFLLYIRIHISLGAELLTFNVNYFLKMCPIFDGSDDNFGKIYDKSEDAFLIKSQNFTLVWMSTFK